MKFSQKNIFQFLVVAGLISFILLLTSFQWILAVVVLIVTIFSYFFLQRAE